MNANQSTALPTDDLDPRLESLGQFFQRGSGMNICLLFLLLGRGRGLLNPGSCRERLEIPRRQAFCNGALGGLYLVSRVGNREQRPCLTGGQSAVAETILSNARRPTGR